ncbi:Hypothetical_protein [Hexamita inflata]|uniref:Hypothetical_protein n=1 Tax=Hexamita inflata TaxID=28002 RepID=A0AA86QC05_9EUKA|nr:Hypothetical protein HINF_LOCUS44089 [Hexamita inflata]
MYWPWRQQEYFEHTQQQAQDVNLSQHKIILANMNNKIQTATNMQEVKEDVKQGFVFMLRESQSTTYITSQMLKENNTRMLEINFRISANQYLFIYEVVFRISRYEQYLHVQHIIILYFNIL